MTSKQEALYWREWAAVRAAWPEADRHELHLRALGTDKSHKTFTNLDFDKVLAEFRSVSRPADLAAQLHQLRQAKKRLLWKITVEQIALLTVLMDGENEFERRAVAEHYVIAVMRDRFHTENIHDLSERRPADDVDSPLEMLRNTLDARINDLRGKRDLTIHQMKTLAGLQCDCSKCCRLRRLQKAA
jgi:hypothetical protein